jgi:hypothetical protein
VVFRMMKVVIDDYPAAIENCLRINTQITSLDSQIAFTPLKYLILLFSCANSYTQ